MQRFVIERDMPGAGDLTGAQLREIAKTSNAVLREMTKAGLPIQWEHSYVTGNRVYCVYLAESEQLIREHAKRASFPCTLVNAVEEIIGPLTETTDRA